MKATLGERKRGLDIWHFQDRTRLAERGKLNKLDRKFSFEDLAATANYELVVAAPADIVVAMK